MDERIRILFIDDQPADIELACGQLRKAAIQPDWRGVDTEAGVREALEQFKPEVVLCDYTIPGYSGRAAFEFVHATQPQLPFLFFSATIGEEVALECLREGATDYILKGNLNRLAPAVLRARNEARARQEALATEAERTRLAEIVELTTDMVIVTDSEHNITYINAAGCCLLGGQRADWVGRPLQRILPAAARKTVFATALPAALHLGSWSGETAVTTITAEEIPVSHVLIAHGGEDGGVRFYSNIARDIRQRKDYEERIQYLSKFDALTGLPNDSLLEDRVAQALAHARRANRMLAVVAIGLDDFRLLQETLGKAALDRLLVDVSAQWRSSVRECDTVARTGPNEFFVLLADLQRAEDAATVVAKLLDATSTPRTISHQELQVSATAGVAVFPADGADFEILTRHAAQAMHNVKVTQRARFSYHSEQVTGDALERLQLESALRHALHRGELSLHYQPVYDIGTGLPSGVEALMRWNLPDGRTIAPDVFIPIAEETGLIRGLGEWALQEACRTMLSWRGTKGAPLTVGVNVSARQLTPDFFDSVTDVLRRTAFPAERLEIEVTESTLMANVASSLETLRRLRKLGVRVAIDDFGTGYSSLAYLSRLPVDRLKVDQSFIGATMTGAQDVTIVQAIISLGQALGMNVLAEGVETFEQLELLRLLGCDDAQGFLLSKPLRSGELHGVLRQARHHRGSSAKLVHAT